MASDKPTVETLSRGMKVALGMALCALVAVPFVTQDFYVGLISQMMILAIFAMSFDLLQGVTGLVSQGHAAYFALAGYALAFLMPADGELSIWWSLPLVVAGAALLALIIGLLVIRVSGIYFIMVTLAISQMIFYLFFGNKSLGGSDGIYINFQPTVTLFGWQIVDLSNKITLYYFILVIMLSVYVFLRRLLWSPFGRALVGIRINEHRMRAIGFSTFNYKLSAFVLSGALAGLAGYLYGAQTGFVSPDMIGFQMSAQVLVMVVLGGSGNFAGAIIGAFAFEYLLFFFKDLPEIAGFDFGKHWQLAMGLLIVLVASFLPNGLLGLLDRFTAYQRQRR